MDTHLKPGDRVRLRDTMCFGTVTGVITATESARERCDATVEWDDCDAIPCTVRADKLEYVRPPPAGWAAPAAGMPCDR